METLFQLIRKTKEIKESDFRKVFNNTVGEKIWFNSFSNMDRHCYFTAICKDGRRVDCAIKVFDSAQHTPFGSIPKSEYVKAGEGLPKDWDHVVLNSAKYSQTFDFYATDVIVARRNDDGTVQIYRSDKAYRCE